MRLTIQTGSDNPLLRTPAKAIKSTELHLVRPLVDAMLAYIRNPRNRGIGLAAPQVGVSQRVIVVGIPRDDEESYTIMPMINPLILSRSEEQDVDEEGCLSLPSARGPVSRPTTIEVEWIDIRGRKMKRVFTGFGARVIQHEVDHLDGVMICDKFLNSQT